jgi:hypothetical protein
VSVPVGSGSALDLLAVASLQEQQSDCAERRSANVGAGPSAADRQTPGARLPDGSRSPWARQGSRCACSCAAAAPGCPLCLLSGCKTIRLVECGMSVARQPAAVASVAHPLDSPRLYPARVCEMHVCPSCLSDSDIGCRTEHAPCGSHEGANGSWPHRHGGLSPYIPGMRGVPPRGGGGPEELRRWATYPEAAPALRYRASAGCAALCCDVFRGARRPPMFFPVGGWPALDSILWSIVGLPVSPPWGSAGGLARFSLQVSPSPTLCVRRLRLTSASDDKTSGPLRVAWLVLC